MSDDTVPYYLSDGYSHVGFAFNLEGKQKTNDINYLLHDMLITNENQIMELVKYKSMKEVKEFYLLMKSPEYLEVLNKCFFNCMKNVKIRYNTAALLEICRNIQKNEYLQTYQETVADVAPFGFADILLDNPNNTACYISSLTLICSNSNLIYSRNHGLDVYSENLEDAINLQTQTNKFLFDLVLD